MRRTPGIRMWAKAALAGLVALALQACSLSEEERISIMAKYREVEAHYIQKDFPDLTVTIRPQNDAVLPQRVIKGANSRILAHLGAWVFDSASRGPYINRKLLAVTDKGTFFFASHELFLDGPFESSCLKRKQCRSGFDSVRIISPEQAQKAYFWSDAFDAQTFREVFKVDPPARSEEV